MNARIHVCTYIYTCAHERNTYLYIHKEKTKTHLRRLEIFTDKGHLQSGILNEINSKQSIKEILTIKET